ncbi:MAG: hypothetical protein IKQ99_00275, partial [Alphaproteobacteria bacterium]|nr:hypothetical protein [Alphaproteobacteria bacterium]
MAKEQFIIADEDVAIALNPEQDIISIDENGNFVEEDGFGGKTYYQRDTKNPNLLHVYDSDGKLTGNVSLSVTPERGVALHSSSLNTENTSDRIVNPDGSYQDSYNVGKNGEIKTIKKDTEGNTITEYSHLDDSGNSHIDHVVERRADGSVSFQNFPQEECTDEEWDKIAAAWKDSEDDGLKFLDFGSSFFPLDFSKRKPTDNEDDEEEDDDETEDEEIEESTPKSLFTDKEVAFALDPKEGNVIVDKDGNFYNKST